MNTADERLPRRRERPRDVRIAAQDRPHLRPICGQDDAARDVHKENLRVARPRVQQTAKIVREESGKRGPPSRGHPNIQNLGKVLLVQKVFAKKTLIRNPIIEPRR